MVLELAARGWVLFGGVWLALSLRRVVQRLGYAGEIISAEGIDSIAEEMTRRLEGSELFSVIPLKLAKSDRFRSETETMWLNQCSEGHRQVVGLDT